MNSKTRIMGKNLLLAIMAILVIIAIVAAIRGGNWRPVWDKMWLWTNFLLVVTAIYWWAWPFLMKMLDGRIAIIGDEIKLFEKEKADLEAQINEIEASLTKSAERFEEIRATMQTEIALKQEHIIENARKEAAAIYEQAKHQRQTIIAEAKKGLKAELVDMAVKNALAKLPAAITDTDQQHLFENFYKNAFKSPQAA